MDRTLVVLIPGLARFTRSAQLSAFVDGLTAASERFLVSEISDDNTAPGIRRLRATSNDRTLEMDVVEAYWNDMVPSLTQETVTTRMLRGLSLIVFWVMSPIWNSFWHRKYLTLGFLTSGIAFIAWYFSTIVLFIDALQENGDNPFPGVLAWVSWFVNWIGGWKVWAGMSVFVALLPVSLLVDITDFAKRYITDEPAVAGQPAVRFEIVKRVREQLLAALQSNEYTSITVIGHSFGSVVAVDLMADLPSQGIPVRVITMGSLIEILAKQASWLRDDVNTLCQRPDLEEWIDVYTDSDWFASGAGVPDSNKCREVKVKSFSTFIDKVAARVHARYFDNQETVRLVLSDNLSSGRNGNQQAQ